MASKAKSATAAAAAAAAAAASSRRHKSGASAAAAAQPPPLLSAAAAKKRPASKSRVDYLADDDDADDEGNNLASREDDYADIKAANKSGKTIHFSFDQFSLRKLYLDKVTGSWRNPFGVFYGPRCTGKTTKIVALLWTIRDLFMLNVLFSPTADATRAFEDIFEPLWTFGTEESITEHALNKIQRIMHYLKKKFPRGIEGQPIRCLILMDDCGPYPIMQSKVLKKLASNGRNSNITLFVAIQSYKQIPPTTRENADFFMSNYTPKRTVRKQMWDDMWSDIGPYEDFLPVFLQATDKMGGFVWTSMPCSEITKKYFTYQPAHMKADFKMMSPLQDFLVAFLQKTEEQRDAEEKEAMDKDLDRDPDEASAKKGRGKQKKSSEEEDGDDCGGDDDQDDDDDDQDDDGADLADFVDDDAPEVDAPAAKGGGKSKSASTAKKKTSKAKAPGKPKVKKPVVHCLTGKSGKIMKFSKADAVEEDIY